MRLTIDVRDLNIIVSDYFIQGYFLHVSRIVFKRKRVIFDYFWKNKLIGYLF